MFVTIFVVFVLLHNSISSYSDDNIDFLLNFQLRFFIILFFIFPLFLEIEFQ